MCWDSIRVGFKLHGRKLSFLRTRRLKLVSGRNTAYYSVTSEAMGDSPRNERKISPDKFPRIGSVTNRIFIKTLSSTCLLPYLQSSWVDRRGGIRLSASRANLWIPATRMCHPRSQNEAPLCTLESLAPTMYPVLFIYASELVHLSSLRVSQVPLKLDRLAHCSVSAGKSG